MRPSRRNNKSQLDAEAQDDSEERWGNTAREICEYIERRGPESSEGRAYDQLKALMGEGSLLHALGAMLRQVRIAESRLAADKNRKKENASATSKLRWVAALLERRQKRAIADARVNTFFDLTFPLGFIRELPNAIAYFEGDNELPSARLVLGLGKHSGGGANRRSKLSIKHAAVGRCAEEAQAATGENCDKPVGVLAAMMFGLEDATATNVERWREQYVRAVGLEAARKDPELLRFDTGGADDEQDDENIA
jgi:hypothetical protein